MTNQPPRGPVQYRGTQDSAPRPGRRHSQTKAPKLLITAASLALTVGGWTAISGATSSTHMPASTASDTTSYTQSDSSLQSLPALPPIDSLPTLVPVTLPPKGAAAAAVPSTQQQASVPTATATAEPALPPVTLPRRTIQQAPITRTRSSR
jgi:hypothetical protein